MLKEGVMADIEEGKKAAGNLAIGAAIGGATGIVLGVLFAPRTGKETRKQVGTWLTQKRQGSVEFLTRINSEAKHKKQQVAAAWQAGQHAYSGKT
jgi:gas vesicle protein